MKRIDLQVTQSLVMLYLFDVQVHKIFIRHSTCYYDNIKEYVFYNF